MRFFTVHLHNKNFFKYAKILRELLFLTLILNKNSTVFILCKQKQFPLKLYQTITIIFLPYVKNSRVVN